MSFLESLFLKKNSNYIDDQIYDMDVQKLLKNICTAFGKIVKISPNKKDTGCRKYQLKDPGLLALQGFEKEQAKEIYNLVILLLAYSEQFIAPCEYNNSEIQLTSDECEMINAICLNKKPQSLKNYALAKGINFNEIKVLWQETLKDLSLFVMKQCALNTQLPKN